MTATNIVPLTPEPPMPAPPAVVRAIIPKTYGDTYRMAEGVCEAGLASKYKNNVAKVASVMLAGMELGLKPLASLRLFYLTDQGQPALTARGMLAAVQASGQMVYYEDGYEGAGDDYAAVVTVQRRGFGRVTRRFSVGEAKTAGLLGKDNYRKYRDRMMWNRAVSFALNDVFADILGATYEPSEVGGPVIDDDGSVIEPLGDAPKAPPKPVGQTEVKLPDADSVFVPRTWEGARQALAVIAAHSPGSVLLNNDLLDRIADNIPEFAERIADLRAAAAVALTPETDDDPVDPADWPEERINTAYDAETGEVVDTYAQKVAERRGAAPADTQDPMPA